MRHFFLRDHHGFPVACIASIVCTPMSGSVNRFDDGPLEPDSMVAFTVSVHNPKDTYDRAKGRHIAEARLQKRKNLHFVTPKPNIKANIMHYLMALTNFHYTFDGKPVPVPMVVKLAAKHWLSVMEAKARVQAMRDAEIAFTTPTNQVPCAEALDAYASPPHPPEEAEVIAERMADAQAVEPEAHFTVDAPDLATPIQHTSFYTEAEEANMMHDGLSGTALEALMAEHPPERAVPWTWANSEEVPLG